MDNPMKPKQPKTAPHSPDDIREQGMKTSVGNALKRGGINTTNDLKNATNDSLMKVKGVGPKSFKEIDPVREKIMKQGFGPNKNTEYVDRIKSMAVFPRIESKYGKDVLDEGMQYVSKVFNSKKPFPSTRISRTNNNTDPETFDIMKKNDLASGILKRFDDSYVQKIRYNDAKLENQRIKEKTRDKAWADAFRRKDKISKALEELLNDQELSTLFEDELKNSYQKSLDGYRKNIESNRIREQKREEINKPIRAKAKIDSMILKHPDLEENREFLEKLYNLGLLK